MKQVAIKDSPDRSTSLHHRTDNSVPRTSMTATGTRRITHVTPGQRSAATFDLTGLPFELLLFLTSYLSAKDIGRLSLTARHFLITLSSSIDGPPVLNRSRDIVQCNAYNERLKTLDLGKILATQEVNFISVKKYQRYLRDIILFLAKNQVWAKTHIKTLIFPLEITFNWNISKELNKIVSFLSGVSHLHIRCQPGKRFQKPENYQTKLFLHLNILKRIPVTRVTLENSTLYPSVAKSLAQAIDEGGFYSGIKYLAFYHTDEANLPLSQYILIKDNTIYPQLTTLDFTCYPCKSLYLNKLPTTVTCLRTISPTQVMGRAPSIKRWEIHYATLPAAENPPGFFSSSMKALPALKEIYMEPLIQARFQHTILARLITSEIPSSLSVQLPRLHVYIPILLQRMQEKFTGGFVIQEEATFHITAPEDMDNFITLARAGMFNHLPKIQYELETLFPALTPSPLLFNKAFTLLLKEGELSQLRHFTIEYRYEPPATAPHLSFLESPEGRALALARTRIPPMSWQDISGTESMMGLKQSFIGVEHQIRTLMNHRIPIEAQDLFFAALQQGFDQIITKNQPPAEQTHTWMEWVFFMEQIHMQLYYFYVHQLQQHTRMSWNFYLYRQLLPHAFQRTALGNRFSIRVQEYLMHAMARHITEDLQSLLAEFGFRGHFKARTTGFTIHLLKPHALEKIPTFMAKKT